MRTGSEPTVFVVDSDTEVQRALRQLMESVRLRVETYSTTQAFIEGYDPSKAGCLILEVRMKGLSGIELFRRLRGEGNRQPVIFLTKHGDVPMAVELMREGAFHFLQKPHNDQQLLDLVHAAVAMDSRIRRQETERLAILARFESLSPREREVLDGIGVGMTSKAMAGRFGVTIKTVEFHRANILKKVGVENVTELVCLLLRSGYQTENHPSRKGHLSPQMQ